MQAELSREIDDLTGLFRRGAFDRDLAELVSSFGENKEPLVLIMADIDKFKSINDTHGHPCGDEILTLVSDIARQTVGAKGACYRYGGEEISILLKNYTADEAASLAERVRKAIESSPLGVNLVAVTMSFGIAELPSHAQAAPDLLKSADAALYEAKNFGRNLVRVSGEAKPTQSSRENQRKQPDLNRLSDKEAEQIRVHYFTYHHAFCPRDNARLRIIESHPTDQRTPTLVVMCALCGLEEWLEGLKRTRKT